MRDASAPKLKLAETFYVHSFVALLGFSYVVI